MSSTNRKNASKRHISDYYVTPKSDIIDFFTNWLQDINDKEDFLSVTHNLKNLIWLDPCAGGDSKNDMSYPWVLENEIGVDPENIVTVDIREDSLAKIKANFIEMKNLPEVDITITNPPFNVAIEIIKKALKLTQQGGYVIMLLRLNFLGSKARKDFWDEFPPKWIYVHHRRMSFTENGATDSIKYAHFVWEVGSKEKTLLKVI